MELRKHPLVSYRNQSSWPPAWIWIGGNENKHPRGEVGVLKQLKLVDGPFVNRCFLWMQYEDSMYLGCLLFSRHPKYMLSSYCIHKKHLLTNGPSTNFSCFRTPTSPRGCLFSLPPIQIQA